MAADDHDLLPEPPPPRPAGRDAAIAAALRRFDGELAAAPEPRQPRTGSWTRHPQLGLALAASLVVLIGFPAAFIVLRDQDSSPTGTSAPPSPPTVQRAEPPAIRPNYDAANAAAPELPMPSAPGQVAKVQPATPAVEADARQAAKVEGNAADDLAAAPPPPLAAPMAAPPPPPPPPPPPAPPAVAEKSAEGAATSDLVVTGSRIASNRGQSAARAERDSEPSAPDFVREDRGYATFLATLQRAVRTGNRGAVAKLVHYPLRVNSGGQSRFYRDSAALRADYERIFTPQVRRAILDQRSDRLFGSSRGLMIGNGAVWFDRVCSNRSCSSPRPVRITAVNP